MPSHRLNENNDNNAEDSDEEIANEHNVGSICGGICVLTRKII